VLWWLETGGRNAIKTEGQIGENFFSHSLWQRNLHVLHLIPMIIFLEHIPQLATFSVFTQRWSRNCLGDFGMERFGVLK